ncbi:hypothetical protein AMJ86_00685 [bacterium SM23_57]|nr:MAG: hypothetical protein AMJ86_00685 [bacterium SM23_57]
MWLMTLTALFWIIVILLLFVACTPCRGQISDQYIQVNENCEGIMPDYTAKVRWRDNCPGQISQVQFPPPGTILTAITNPATITARDASGNTTVVRFNVHLWDTVGPTLLPYTDTLIGFVDPFRESTDVGERRAQEYIAKKDIIIDFIGQWHESGTGTRAIFAVHRDTLINSQHRPGKTISSTGIVTVNKSSGNEEWNVPDVFIPKGNRYWLSWVYEKNPGIRTQPGDGKLNRARADGKFWADGMPSDFGPSSISNYNYSIYAVCKLDDLAYTPEMIAQMYLQFEKRLRYDLNFFISRFGWDIVGGTATTKTYLRIPVEL